MTLLLSFICASVCHMNTNKKKKNWISAMWSMISTFGIDRPYGVTMWNLKYEMDAIVSLYLNAFLHFFFLLCGNFAKLLNLAIISTSVRYPVCEMHSSFTLHCTYDLNTEGGWIDFRSWEHPGSKKRWNDFPINRLALPNIFIFPCILCMSLFGTVVFCAYFSYSERMTTTSGFSLTSLPASGSGVHARKLGTIPSQS